MDLLLNNLLKGMSLNGSPDENLAQYTEFIESVDLTDADLMKFLRLMAACVASSKTLNFLTFFFQKRLATGLNLKEFSDLYPSEPDFLLDCLRIITSKHAEIEQPSLLEYLQLNPSNLEKVASNAEKFPRLVSLFLDWNRGGVFLIPLDKEEWDPLKKFTKLTDLQNCYLEFPEYLEFILSIIGANLNSLQIDYSHQARNDIDLKRIQEYCPKLKQLKMVNNTGVDDNFSFESFTSLLDLQTKFKSGSCKELKLSNFLAAPKLKTVDLNGIQVSRKELRDTIDLIKSKRILTKALSINNGPHQENLVQIYEKIVSDKDLTHNDVMQFLHKLAAHMDSSNTLIDFMSLIFSKLVLVSKMNLEEFSDLYPSDPDFLLKVLPLIPLKEAQKILELKIFATDGKLCSSPLNMKQEMLTEFTKMKNLNSIEIDKYYFNLKDLVEMSRNWPALRTVKHLQKLREIRCVNTIFNMTKACEEMERTSQLQSLQLIPHDLDKVAYSSAEKFPDVVSVTLDWHRVFSKIAIDLKVIQENCPKLEKLGIINTDVENSFSLESFTSLLDLHIHFKSGCCKEVELSKLLAAPKLQIVKLIGIRVSRKELRDTIDLIKSKRILTEVNSVILTMNANINPVMKKALKKEIDSFATAVRSGRQKSEIDVQLNFS
ncbi:Hypothetical predicted protein [Cloeon dipterum]|uniref:Uncharacterized protein n=1 Tax=Cloeon dipterum TaxID=197152 RepID=A0A8S1D3S0_9INSE|nr:Hypothetical predicted protein [Cloeon dipterum]